MFNVKLYKDMVKQLRLSGMVITILSILISCYRPICDVLSYKSSTMNFDYGNITKLVDITPVLLFAVFMGGAMFPLIAFSFLNKRNSSDYYHSLPNTRICTFLSIFSAITTWIFIMVIPTVLIASAVYFACGLNFNLVYIVYLICAYCASSLLVSAVTSIAMCITGTLFSNIILMGLIGFLPRFIGILISQTTLSLAQITDIKSLGLLNYQYNLPVAFVFKILDNSTKIDNLLGFEGGILYTFILALLYVGIACFLFIIRKSEAADKNAPNRISQHIYRCAITLPVVFVSTTILASRRQPLNNMQNWIIPLILAVFVYLAYEIITTKSVKKMISCSPYFFVVVAVSLGISYSSYFISESILNKTPSSQEIKHVKFIEPSRSNDISYYEYQLNQVNFDNIVVKDIISKWLVQNVNAIREKDSIRNSLRSTINVLITLNNDNEIYRWISLSNEDMDKIKQVQFENSSYLRRLSTTPDDKNITQLEVYGMGPKESRELFNSYKQELSESSNEVLMNIMSGSGNLVGFQPITVYSAIGVEHYYDNFNINKCLPNTSMMFCDIVNKRNQKSYYNNLDYVTSYNVDTAKEDDRFQLSITESSANTQTGTKRNAISLGCNATGNNYVSAVSLEQIKSLVSVLKKCSIENIDFSKPYFWIEISTPLPNDEIDNLEFYSRHAFQDKMFVQATNEQLDEIHKIID